MIAVFLSLVIVFLFIAKEIYSKRDIIRFSNTVKGPIFLPIVDVLTQLTKFKFPISLWIGHTYSYWTNDPSEIRDILTSKHTLDKSDDFYFYKFIIGDTLLLAEDQAWRLKRKIAAKVFLQNVLNSYVKIFYKQSCDLADELVNDRTPDLLKVLYKTTINIFFEAADLGTTISYDIIDKLFYIIELMTKRFYNPLYHYDFIYFKTSDGILLNRSIQATREHLISVIQERRKSIKAGGHKEGESEKSVLELLLQDYPTDQEALDEILLLTGAASTTTKTTLAFACVLLAMHPDIQEKVYQEIETLIGNNPIDHKNLPTLKLTERVIQECLRLFPVTLVLSRKAKNTVKIGQKLVPKNTNLKVFILDVHRNEKYWTNPLKFDPDRFLPEEVEKRDPYTYIPFSAGIRNCIGFKYGIMVMKTTLAVLVRRFHLTTEFKSIDDLTLKEGIILGTEEELKCTFTPRKV